MLPSNHFVFAYYTKRVLGPRLHIDSFFWQRLSLRSAAWSWRGRNVDATPWQEPVSSGGSHQFKPITPNRPKYGSSLNREKH